MRENKIVCFGPWDRYIGKLKIDKLEITITGNLCALRKDEIVSAFQADKDSYRGIRQGARYLSFCEGYLVLKSVDDKVVWSCKDLAENEYCKLKNLS